MRESTRNTISMLSDMWKRNFPMADFDAFMLVSEIVCAYENRTVSPESCMEEISAIFLAKQKSEKERFRVCETDSAQEFCAIGDSK